MNEFNLCTANDALNVLGFAVIVPDTSRLAGHSITSCTHVVTLLLPPQPVKDQFDDPKMYSHDLPDKYDLFDIRSEESTRQNPCQCFD